MRRLNITLSPAFKEHHPEILSIAEVQLGAAYLDASALRAGDGVHAVVALVENKVVGFCLGRIVPLKNYLDSNPRIRALGLAGLLGTPTAGLISTVAVSPEHTGFGVGRHVVAACIELLMTSGAQALMMTAWKSKKGVHIEKLAAHFGFVSSAELRDYWLEDSLKAGYCCASCGPPPCKCSAIFFFKHCVR